MITNLIYFTQLKQKNLNIGENANIKNNVGHVSKYMQYSGQKQGKHNDNQNVTGAT